MFIDVTTREALIDLIYEEATAVEEDLHALETEVAAAKARAASAEASAAVAKAAAAASRVLETKLSAAEVRAAAEPAPAIDDNSPLRATGIVFHDDDDDRFLEEEIEGRDGGRWDSGIADDEFRSDDDGVLDEEEKYMAWEQSAEAVAAAFGLRLRLRPKIDDGCQAELCTGALTRREESPPPPAPDGASATGCTYDDMTKLPPSHLRCVVSPLSSLSPVLRCTTASRSRLWSPISRG